MDHLTNCRIISESQINVSYSYNSIRTMILHLLLGLGHKSLRSYDAPRLTRSEKLRHPPHPSPNTFSLLSNKNSC